MKTRVRQLENGKWITEARRWYQWNCHGVRMESVPTYGSMRAGVENRCPEFHAPGSINYSTCYFQTEGRALAELREVRSHYGA